MHWLQLVLLLVSAAVRTARDSGAGRDGVYFKCNGACIMKYADELKTNNMELNDELLLQITRCIYQCMQGVNEKLREKGREDLVESTAFVEPFTRRTKSIDKEPLEKEPAEKEKEKENKSN